MWWLLSLYLDLQGVRSWCSGGRAACPKLAAKGWWGKGAACLGEGKSSSGPHSCCSWECPGLLAQHNPTSWHLQRPAFPHTHASTHSEHDLLWRYWTKCKFFFLKFWIEIQDSYSSGAAMAGAVSLEPPSLSTQTCLLMQALENAVEMRGRIKVVKSACAPGAAKSAIARQQKLSDTVQNRPGKIFRCWCWNLCENLKLCAVRRSSWK